MTEEKTYPVLCAWCKEEVGRSNVEGSHTVCEKCAKGLGVDLPEARQDLKKKHKGGL